MKIYLYIDYINLNRYYKIMKRNEPRRNAFEVELEEARGQGKSGSERVSQTKRK